MKTTYSEEYRVSQRVVLRPGDKFRATGGPYYETTAEDGTKAKTKTGDRGPFTFIRHAKCGRQEWIEAISQTGFTVLDLGKKKRWEQLTTVVRAPWKIKGKVATTARAKAKSAARKTNRSKTT